MIESIEFTNFKALRKTVGSLAPFTLLMGPNGSGKTTVLQALRAIATVAASKAGISRPDGVGLRWASLLSITAEVRDAPVQVKLRLQLGGDQTAAIFRWTQSQEQVSFDLKDESRPGSPPPTDVVGVRRWLGRIQTCELNAAALAQPVPVSGAGLHPNGTGLAAVLDDLKDNHSEKEGLEVKMTRLADIEHVQEILGHSPLSEVWYSGVLGGVAAKP